MALVNSPRKVADNDKRTAKFRASLSVCLDLVKRVSFRLQNKEFKLANKEFNVSKWQLMRYDKSVLWCAVDEMEKHFSTELAFISRGLPCGGLDILSIWKFSSFSSTGTDTSADNTKNKTLIRKVRESLGTTGSVPEFLVTTRCQICVTCFMLRFCRWCGGRREKKWRRERPQMCESLIPATV